MVRRDRRDRLREPPRVLSLLAADVHGRRREHLLRGDAQAPAHTLEARDDGGGVRRRLPGGFVVRSDARRRQRRVIRQPLTPRDAGGAARDGAVHGVAPASVRDVPQDFARLRPKLGRGEKVSARV